MSAGRALLAGGSLLVLLAGCRSAPPPPPPAAAPVTEAAPTVPAPPPEIVRVTGSRLNVRRDPATSAAVIARVKRGETLVVLGRDAGWVHVRLPAGGDGWVSALYVRSEAPCPADKAGAELLSDVPLSFSEGASIGKVVIEATVDATGSVASTRVVTDTTGIPELVKRADDEVHTLKFSPPIRDCHPVAFLYTFTRNF
jgi:Bacterial SH3 domain